jgi:uncharacterized protein (TIGR03067 family)
MPAASAVRADDAQHIVGVWTPVSVESDGNVYTLEQLKPIAAKLTFTITKDKIMAPIGGANELSYELGTEADPKTIDTVDVDGPRKGERRKGIYELRGDTLQLCIAAKDAPRPQHFSTKPGPKAGGERVITFQRKKAP